MCVRKRIASIRGGRHDEALTLCSRCGASANASNDSPSSKANMGRVRRQNGYGQDSLTEQPSTIKFQHPARWFLVRVCRMEPSPAANLTASANFQETFVMSRREEAYRNRAVTQPTLLHCAALHSIPGATSL
jgi:hypothetical protein